MDNASKGQRIALLIVDPHLMVRDGIAAMVAECDDIEIVGAAATAEQGLALFSSLLPDVTLMDVDLPDMDGAEAVQRICGEFPGARILTLALAADDLRALRALRAGAAAYLVKARLRREMIETIRAVHAGWRAVAPKSG